MRLFRSAQLKIDRANHHISDVDARINIFLEANPCALRPQYNPKTAFTEYMVEDVTEVDPSISLVIGDAVHNLRAALDHLVVALVKDAGSSLTKSTYFPISDSLGKYTTTAPGQVKGISVPDEKRIDSLQPYLGGDDRFWWLHRMDITDKHNLILTQTQCVGGINYAVSDADALGSLGFPDFLGPNPSTEKKPVMIPWSGPLLVPKKGEILFHFPGNTEKDKDMKPSFDIAFGDAEVFKDKLVIPTLRELADLVKGVVKVFA
jgi:hypothetical protein